VPPHRNRAQQPPLGIPNDSSKGETTDVGVKIYSPNRRVSATIAWSKNFLRDDAIAIDGTYVTEINPTGVNGQYQPLGLAANSQINADRKSQAWEVSVDTKPTKNWRSSFKFSTTDGTILNTTQLDGRHVLQSRTPGTVP